MRALVTKYYQAIFVVLIGTIAGLSFYVGMLEGEQRGGSGVILSCSPEVLSSLAIPVRAIANGMTTSASPASGAFAGSKNGTKYYTPGCAGLERIKPENRVWFQNAEDATLQGYTPASC